MFLRDVGLDRVRLQIDKVSVVEDKRYPFNIHAGWGRSAIEETWYRVTAIVLVDATMK
jgi:hypothetical protein